MIKGHTSHTFRQKDFDEHKNVLKKGRIGRYIAEYCEKQGIKAEKADKLPDSVSGLFVSSVFGKGKILYGEMLNSLILAHEGRHAWQHNFIPRDVLCPRSPEEFAIYWRFLEADAHAVHFAATLEALYEMGETSVYAEGLHSCLNYHERDIVDANRHKIGEIVNNPEKFAQIMRGSFDQFMINSINSPYDDQIVEMFRDLRNPTFKLSLSQIIFGDHHPLPRFTSSGIRPEYIDGLVNYLGFTGDPNGINYITETKGPDLHSRFYTDFANYKIEREAAHLNGQESQAPSCG